MRSRSHPIPLVRNCERTFGVEVSQRMIQDAELAGSACHHKRRIDAFRGRIAAQRRNLRLRPFRSWFYSTLRYRERVFRRSLKKLNDMSEQFISHCATKCHRWPNLHHDNEECPACARDCESYMRRRTFGHPMIQMNHGYLNRIMSLLSGTGAADAFVLSLRSVMPQRFRLWAR